MQKYAKLLPILVLGTALSGCSMAGFGDVFGGNFGQQGQHWASNSYCAEQFETTSVNASVNTAGCQSAYPVAQSNVAAQPFGGQVYGGQAVASQYGAQAVAPSAYAAAQTVAPTYGAQSYVAPTVASAGVAPAFASGQSFPAYQGQQGFQGGGFAPAFVGPRSRSSNGLRQSYTYGTLGAVLYDTDSDLFGIQGRLGWQSKSFYGAEVEGSFGVAGEDNTAFDFGAGLVGAEADIDTQIAAFAVGRYPVSNRLNVLGRIGYHNTEFDVESTFNDGLPELEDDFSDDGLAYGAGVEYAINPRTSVRADYTIYDFDGPNGDAISLAVSRKF